MTSSRRLCCHFGCLACSSAAPSGSVYTTDERLILIPCSKATSAHLKTRKYLWSFLWFFEVGVLRSCILYQQYAENVYVLHLVVQRGSLWVGRKQGAESLVSAKMNHHRKWWRWWPLTVVSQKENILRVSGDAFEDNFFLVVAILLCSSLD